MTLQAHEQTRIDQLRTEYKTATEDRRRAIVETVNKIKDNGLCYECKLDPKDPESDHFPFCSPICHERFADREYKNSPTRRQPTIQDLQRRLLEMAKQKHVEGVTKH